MGYFGDDSRYRAAIQWWMQERHGWQVEPDHIFTTQAHPEFTAPFMACVLDATRPQLDAAQVASAEATLTRPNHGAHFALWATQFFGGNP